MDRHRLPLVHPLLKQSTPRRRKRFFPISLFTCFFFFCFFRLFVRLETGAGRSTPTRVQAIDLINKIINKLKKKFFFSFFQIEFSFSPQANRVC